MDLLLLLLAAGLIVAGYIASVRTYPYRPCRRCDSRGRDASTRGRTYRLCRWCGGTGHALRPSARLFGISSFRTHRKRPRRDE